MNSGPGDCSTGSVCGAEEVCVDPYTELSTGNSSPGDLRSRPNNSNPHGSDEVDQKLEDGALLDLMQLVTLTNMLRGGATSETLESQLTPLLTHCGPRPAHLEMFNQLDNLKQTLNERFHSQGDLRFLNLAIQCQEKLITWTSKQDKAYPGRLGTLGGFYASRFTCSRDLNDLHQAIEYEKLGVSLTPTNDPYESNRLGNLGMSYTWLYQATGRVEDIDNAINTYKKVVSLTPYGHPKTPGRLVGLGIAYQNRFMRLGRIDDINTAVKLQEQAASLIPDHHEGMVHCLINLGISYRCYYERTKQIKYADLAVLSHTKARSLTPPNDNNLPNLLLNLAISYEARFSGLRNVEDINKAIGLYEEAVTLVSTDVPMVPPPYLQRLGTSYLSRFKRLGDLQDLNKAIELCSQAVAMNIESDPDAAEMLTDLGNAHLSRFVYSGEVNDLNKVMECYTQAVSKTPPNHVRLPDRLCNLGNAYESHFRRFGQIHHLQKAIDCHNQALSLVPEGDVKTSHRLGNLGSCLAERFDKTGRLEDLERAIELQTQSVALATEDDIDLPFKKMNLGVVLHHRFGHLGKLRDIDQAIELQTHAMSLLSSDHPGLIPLLGNLATSHSYRFNSLQHSYDINRAIELHEQVLKLTPDNHSDKLERLYKLGRTYSNRFSGLGDFHDLELAIAHISKAVSLTPNDHPRMAMRLTSLGNNYAHRFEQLGQLEDADKALEYHSKALLLPKDHMDYPGFLNNLGLTHYYRYQQSGNNEDIDKAIEYQTHAVSLVPDNHINIPCYFSNLARAHLIKFQRLGDPKSLTSSFDYFKKSAQTFLGQPWRRIDDAYTWAQHTPTHLINERLQAYQTAMDIIPELVWVGTSITQRYKNIQQSQIGSMALEAASVAIQAQKYHLALQWLEQGRSVVWSQTLQLRTPVHDLAEVNSELAGKLQQVAEELYNSSTKNITNIAPYDDQKMEPFSQRQRRLAEKYKDLLDEVRRHPGFESFLKPKLGSELVHAARTGPFVVLNIHESRCDALVLVPGSGDVTHIPLPSLSYLKMQEAWVAIQHSLHRRGARQRDCVRRPFDPEEEEEEEFESMLADLWTGVAKPIINALGLKPADTTEKLSHITWCVTGSLSFLPLHAAGYYNGDGAKLSDYAISSYTPTLSALFPTDMVSSETGISVLAVGQEATPGHARLPHTTSELNHIKQYIQPPYTFTEITGQNATIDAVLDSMQAHDWIHLACHAHQNVNNPTDSGIFLHDGTLSIAAITERRFKRKGLAFLSACQTATGDQKLVDESVHLASAMLAAGYSSVIATMWSIVDADGPVIAEKFYEQVVKNNQTNYRGTAEALHVAVGQLRDRVGERGFQHWVPFVHFGM